MRQTTAHIALALLPMCICGVARPARGATPEKHKQHRGRAGAPHPLVLPGSGRLPRCAYHPLVLTAACARARQSVTAAREGVYTGARSPAANPCARCA